MITGMVVPEEISGAWRETTTRDDAHARRLLQCALGAFQKWPEGFAGFAAAIRCRDGQNEAHGHVRVFASGRVNIRLEEEGLAAWAHGELEAMSMARTPRFFKEGDGRFPIAFELAADHPLGRGVRVHLGDTAWRTYRIDHKGRIRHQESAEPTKRTTATYDGFVRTCPGRILPTRIQTLKWNVMSQTVIEETEIEDAYERRDHVWLPVSRRTTLAHAAACRELILSGHTLL